jgi:hypothetical protein
MLRFAPHTWATSTLSWVRRYGPAQNYRRPKLCGGKIGERKPHYRYRSAVPQALRGARGQTDLRGYSAARFGRERKEKHDNLFFVARAQISLLDAARRGRPMSLDSLFLGALRRQEPLQNVSPLIPWCGFYRPYGA